MQPEPREITSQSHGNLFQNIIKGDEWYSGASNHKRLENASFDIEGKFDRRLGLPTQVKISGTNTFPLADARRFYEIDEPYRNVLGHWVQDRDIKRVMVVSEFIMHGIMMEILRGRTTHAEVSDCHEAIRALPEGHTQAERDRIDRRIAAMHRRTPLLTFNPKINEGNQRLQVSVNLTVLGRMARIESRYKCSKGQLHPNRQIFTQSYGKRIRLPLLIQSGMRSYKDGSGGRESPAYQPLPDLFDDMWHLEQAPLQATEDKVVDEIRTEQVSVKPVCDWDAGSLFAGL